MTPKARQILCLEVLRARKGDCLLLHYGTSDNPRLALIDGGASGVYKRFLRPRLNGLRAERGLGEIDPLRLDLMMLSHIDDDHANGLLQMTRELVDAKENRGPSLVRVLSLWHNSFDDIAGGGSDELSSVDYDEFSASSNHDDPLRAVGQLEDAQCFIDASSVLASVPQGRRFRDDAIRLGIENNMEVGGGLIVASAESRRVDMGNGLKFTVVGPMRDEVEELRRVHDEWVSAHPQAACDSASVLAAYVDRSIPNLSSIVVLAESHRKRMLLNGNARGDKILEGLELVGRLDRDGTIRVDVLKCPHHGSANNVDEDFFSRIVADHYVFSGNGEHGNPERTTIEMLVAARADGEYRIHLTYPVDEIDVERKKEWDKRRAEEKRRNALDSTVSVRAEWSAPTHSLKSYFHSNPSVGHRVVIVDEHVPHTIDLLEPR